MLLKLIGRLKARFHPRAVPLLESLTRHASRYVREMAARALLGESPKHIKQMTHLLNDSHPALSRLICERLGQRRDGWAEKVLLAYLRKAYSQASRQKQDETHLLECYRALGRCALPRAIPFLQNILLKKNWRALLGVEGHCHRRGAALALLLMPAEWNAGPILKKAAQSPFRNVRLACRQAFEEAVKHGRSEGDDQKP